MTKRLLISFYAFLLVFLAVGMATAQTESLSRSNSGIQQIAPEADHHQYLFSINYVGKSTTINVITAQDVTGLLDKAGIRRAVVLSTSYSFGRPGREPSNEYEVVKAENDWTAAQVALFPKRLMGFCGFNPLKDYALDELARCAKNPNLRNGIKMHFGNSDVQTENPEHFEKLKRVFQAANTNRTAIFVHMRASISLKRPYGPEQARRFLELLSLAPDIPVQVAHMASSGPGFNDPTAHSVIEVLADAVAKKDPRTRNFYFDVASNAFPTNSPELSDLIVRLIRQIGVKRILYGSDAYAAGNLEPLKAWEAFRQLKLSEKEFKTIAKNKAPYFR
jgi:predicted TIM-barrel fold metal-dependent hydrolase